MRHAAIIIDVETASMETNEVIQLAWATPDGSQQWSHKYKPSGPMQLGALATHHILPSELEHCEPSSQALLDVPDCEYVIGHNVDYDADALGGMPGVKRICTLAMARKLWPDLDCHKLGALMYYLMGESAETREKLRGAHDAMMDVQFCHMVFLAIGFKTGFHRIHGSTCPFDLEKMYAYSEAARIPTVMPFGKHKGTPIDQVPSDYVGWLLRQSDVDPYVRAAFERTAVAR